RLLPKGATPEPRPSSWDSIRRVRSGGERRTNPATGAWLDDGKTRALVLGHATVLTGQQVGCRTAQPRTRPKSPPSAPRRGRALRPLASSRRPSVDNRRADCTRGPLLKPLVVMGLDGHVQADIPEDPHVR